MKVWQHLKTITKHRWLVLKGCFRVGLYAQGLTHDLSKYSPTEFRMGAKYYQGTRSPNAAEREDKGYSEAWMHHKGRNRHHYEYWTDMNRETKRYELSAHIKHHRHSGNGRCLSMRTDGGERFQSQRLCTLPSGRKSGPQIIDKGKGCDANGEPTHHQ